MSACQIRLRSSAGDRRELTRSLAVAPGLLVLEPLRDVAPAVARAHRLLGDLPPRSASGLVSSASAGSVAAARRRADPAAARSTPSSSSSASGQPDMGPDRRELAEHDVVERDDRLEVGDRDAPLLRLARDSPPELPLQARDVLDQLPHKVRGQAEHAARQVGPAVDRQQPRGNAIRRRENLRAGLVLDPDRLAVPDQIAQDEVAAGSGRHDLVGAHDRTPQSAQIALDRRPLLEAPPLEIVFDDAALVRPEIAGQEILEHAAEQGRECVAQHLGQVLGRQLGRCEHRSEMGIDDQLEPLAPLVAARPFDDAGGPSLAARSTHGGIPRWRRRP